MGGRNGQKVMLSLKVKVEYGEKEDRNEINSGNMIYLIKQSYFILREKVMGLKACKTSPWTHELAES